ncbi:hypothetical protein ILYODFUR_038133 [Ilyodon furcidens]|uniref:Uncharacterized protein n=1 Tax=Ilyodon furcidens TaxID=33524 RepID=A0ABV0U298_9TELE
MKNCPSTLPSCVQPTWKNKQKQSITFSNDVVTLGKVLKFQGRKREFKVFFLQLNVRFKQPKIFITLQKEEKDRELVSYSLRGERTEMCFQLQISYRSENTFV